MSLFRPDVRLEVLRLRNERLLQGETNVPLSSIMANRQYSRPDGDALNDRETDFSYEEEDKFETQVGDDVREYAKQEKRQERENKQAENEIIADAEEEKRAEERIEEMALGSKKGGAMKRCVGSGEPASLAPASVGGRAVQKAKSKATQEAEEVEKLKKKKRKSKKEQELLKNNEKKGGKRKASDKMKRRSALVKKLMAEKGMKLGEASKYIKANNISY